MKAIININEKFGTLDGVFTEVSEIRSKINQHLKNGTAKKLIDTDETVMYYLDETKSNMHPIFAEALKPFGIY